MQQTINRAIGLAMAAKRKADRSGATAQSEALGTFLRHLNRARGALRREAPSEAQACWQEAKAAWAQVPLH